MNRYISLGVSLLCAILITIFINSKSLTNTVVSEQDTHTTIGLLNQSIDGQTASPKKTTCLYYQDSLVGVITDQSVINRFLKDLYKKDYQSTFEDSKLSLSDNLYVTTIQDYNIYHDIDDQIIDYIKANDLISVKATCVELTDTKGKTYAKFYVKNEEIYKNAMQRYLNYYISQDDFNLLNNGLETPPLKTYGSRPIGITIAQTITLEDTFVSKDQIKMTEDEILDYIKYGDNNERSYYTVVQNDTVAGVGMKNFGLSATQIMNINSDKIQSVDQVLEEGMELCVTYFTPIIDVIISKEHMKKEAIYFDAIYQQDDS